MKPVLHLLPISQLQSGRYQPRHQFDQDALAELAQSLIANGMIQPIVVRPLLGSEPTRFEIIAGERRFLAAKKAGLQEIPCLVNQYSDAQAAAVSMVENLNRVNLNPVEEAKAYQRLILEFGYLHEEVAAIVGKSRVKITNTLRLLKLDERVQHALISGELTEGHGKILAGLAAHLQFDLATQAIRYGWSVRKLENQIHEVTTAPFHEKPVNPKLSPEIVRLERLLAEQIGAGVAFEQDGNAESGWLKIRYYDFATLSGVLTKLGVPDEE